jgi:hypothetical protein
MPCVAVSKLRGTLKNMKMYSRTWLDRTTIEEVDIKLDSNINASR